VRIRQGLNVESGLNDGLSVPVFLVAMALAADAGGWHVGSLGAELLRQIGFGVVGGLLVGGLGGLAFRLAAEHGLMHDYWRRIANLSIARKLLIAPTIAVLLLSMTAPLALSSLASQAKLRQQLDETSAALEDATGVRPYLFRPPFGARRPGTFKTVEELKMYPVMWRVTCFDWAAKSHEEILKHARRQISGGEVVLLHDGGHLFMGEDRSHTVRATDELIAEYKDKGYLFTTVTEMMQMRPGVEMPFGARALK